MNKLIIILLINLFLTISILAQENYSLKKCIEIGLEQNYDIKIIKKQQKISENNASLGNAGYLPTISFDAGYNGNFFNFQNQVPNPNGDVISNTNFFNQSFNAGLNLNWTIFDGFYIQSNYQKLQQLKEIGELNTKTNIELFVTTIATEYYTYIEQKNIYENLLYAVSLSKERLRIVQERYYIGAVSRLDLQQALVDFNRDSSKLIGQNEVLFSSLLRLNQLMAIENNEQQINIDDSIFLLNSIASKEDLLKSALQNNINLQILQSQQEIIILDLKSYKSQNYPYLKFKTGYGYNYNFYDVGSYKSQNNLGLNFGFNLGFIIFDGMNRKRNIENAKINIDSQQLNQEKLKLDITTNFGKLWQAYQNNIKLSNLENENRYTAIENYEIAMDRYKLGNLSGIELREAQNSLLEAEQRYILTKYNTKICEILILQICGMLEKYLE